MGKRIPVISVAEPAAVARLGSLPLEATVALADVAGSIKDGLLAFASATGLLVMRQMMEAELRERIGPKHARIPEGAGNWHGSARGTVVLGGRRGPASWPRGRTSDGTEVALDTWVAFSSDALLSALVIGCWPESPHAATPTSASHWATSSRPGPAPPAARPSRGASSGPRSGHSASCWPATCLRLTPRS